MSESARTKGYVPPAAAGQADPRRHRRTLRTIATRLLPLTAGLLVLACVPGSGAGSQNGAPARAIEYLAGFDLSGTPGMGGISGAYVRPDGGRLTAVTDDGRLLSGPLDHHASGTLDRWRPETQRYLPGLAGEGKVDTDAEALVRQSDGSWLVALERRHRILRYSGGGEGPDGIPEPLSIPDSMRALPANKGIEALTVRPDGILVAFAEAKEDDSGEHRLYLRDTDGDWTEKRYRTDPFYSPSDAAALPDGDILVLDRGYSLLAGVRARLVLIKSEDLLSKQPVEGILLGELEPPVGIDNFEALAVRRLPQGTIVAYVISDDNFSPLQRTLLVQYALHPAAGGETTSP